MILLIDAESSGLYRDTLAPEDDSQPHLLQLGLKMVDDTGRRIHRHTALVQPDGWSIEPAAELVHGISERRAHRYGVPLIEAIRPLRYLAPMAKVIVGHGIQNFDRQLITSALHRLKAKGDWWREAAQKIVDTIEAATPLCAIPSETAFSKYKFPTLEEAAAILCPYLPAFVSTHDAEDDIEATQALYFEVLKRQAAIAPVARRL